MENIVPRYRNSFQLVYFHYITPKFVTPLLVRIVYFFVLNIYVFSLLCNSAFFSAVITPLAVFDMMQISFVFDIVVVVIIFILSFYIFFIKVIIIMLNNIGLSTETCTRPRSMYVPFVSFLLIMTFVIMLSNMFRSM